MVTTSVAELQHKRRQRKETETNDGQQPKEHPCEYIEIRSYIEKIWLKQEPHLGEAMR